MKNTKQEIYNETNELEGELERIQGCELTPRNKELLKKFYDQNQVGKLRQLKTLKVLRNIGLKLNKDFDKTTKEDIQEYVNWLNKSDYSEWTRHDYKAILKLFYKWLLGNNEEYPEQVKWVKQNKKYGRTKLPEELLTQEDVYNLLRNAETDRNRALISLLYETGARIGEVRGLRIKNLSFDQFGCKLTLNGKTGMRRVIVRECVPYLKAYLNNHPRINDPESFVFLSNAGNFMSYVGTCKILKGTFERTGLKKKCNPHLFRHSRATFMANHLTEAQMKNYFGWTQSSEMASVYVHLSGRDVDEAVLSNVYGLKQVKDEAEKSKITPKTCPKCKELNPVTNKFCGLCSNPLDEEANEMVSQVRQAIDKVIGEALAKQLNLTTENLDKISKELLITQQVTIPNLK